MAQVTDPRLSLESLFPELAAEWDWAHPNNKGVTPTQVMATSGRVVRWVCANCSYRWGTRVANRTKNGYGCTPCSRRESAQESALRAGLGEVFALSEVSSLPRVDGVSSRPWQVDIVSEVHGFVVEFDGSWWHSERCNPGAAVRDARKAEDLRGQGWVVVRVREEPLVALSEFDVVVPLLADAGVVVGVVVERLLGLGVVAG